MESRGCCRQGQVGQASRSEDETKILVHQPHPKLLAVIVVLGSRTTQNSFYGGNFWDMRATGVMLTNSAAEQAQGPPVNPVVWKASESEYSPLITSVWGAQSFAIHWPSEVVHFYNTSQKLPRCAQGSPGEKVTCWPPEYPATLNTTQLGNLGLTATKKTTSLPSLRR